MISVGWVSLKRFGTAGRKVRKGGNERDASSSNTSVISLKKMLTPFPQHYKYHYFRNAGPGKCKGLLALPLAVPRKSQESLNPSTRGKTARLLAYFRALDSLLQNSRGYALCPEGRSGKSPLHNASTVRHIWKRTITEPAQLCTVTHLLSIKKRESHLSPCHAVFCIYFGSLSSEPR